MDNLSNVARWPLNRLQTRWKAVAYFSRGGGAVRKWRRYANGKFNLGQLKGQAVATWRDENSRVKHRYRLGVYTEQEGRAALDSFAKQSNALDNLGAVTIGQIWERYLIDRRADGKNTVTMVYLWKALELRFSRLLPANIDADICRGYAQARLDAGKSVGTAWTELNQLRSLIKWAVKHKVITAAPYVWVPAKPKAKDRVLDQDEVGLLLDACFSPHIRLFVILALTTAARTEAILELEWTRVDFVGGSIDLRKGAAKQSPLSKASRKGRAIVPMNNLARAALLDAKAGALTDHVIEWDGVSVDSIKTGFYAACERAGLNFDGQDKLERVTPHTLRHTANSWMADADIPEETRARYLGQKSVQVNRDVYTHTSVKHLQPASEVLNIKLPRIAK